MNKIYRGEIYFKFMKEKMQNSKLNQKEICKKIGISTTTLHRIREELNIPSVYRYEKPIKNKKKKEQTEETQEDFIKKIIKPTKKKEKKEKEKSKKVHDEIGGNELLKNDYYSKSDDELH